MRSVGGRLATVIVRFAAPRTSCHRGLAHAHRDRTPFRRLLVADNPLRKQRTGRNRRSPHGPARWESPMSFARAVRRGTADQQHGRRACRRGRQRERDGCRPQNQHLEEALEAAAAGDRVDRRSASCRFARAAFPTRQPSSSRTRQALAGLAARPKGPAGQRTLSACARRSRITPDERALMAVLSREDSRLP
jgi:hypothetical protein